MFKVSTIDSFFQKVLRAFAVEMGKRGVYETVLEDSSAIEPAVDAMYTKLGENKDLLDAMRVIANSKIRIYPPFREWRFAAGHATHISLM